MKDKILLTTVWHTGTKYFREGLRREYDVVSRHINKINYLKIKNDILFTTYRDPYRVAASWINRGHFNKENKHLSYQRWVEQWFYYQKLLAKEPVILDFSKGPVQVNIDFGEQVINSFDDKQGAHKAIDEGNLEHLYQHLPEKHIQFAIECCGDLYKGKH